MYGTSECVFRFFIHFPIKLNFSSTMLNAEKSIDHIQCCTNVIVCEQLLLEMAV